MDRVVNRIRLNKLYSQPKVFEPIIFNDGVNIILGEKFDSQTIKGRKTNGVGKSMSIDFINFCLLKKYNDCRISHIPEKVLDKKIYIKLDLTIGKNDITIMRNKSKPDNPIIIKNNTSIKFDNLKDAHMYLKDLVYNNIKTEVVPSFRSLISPLIRDERSEFKNILECFDVSKKIPINFEPHLFFLNISLNIYATTQEIVKKIEEVKNISRDAKKEVTENNTKKISDVRVELNALDDELNKMNEAIEQFKSYEAFDVIEKELLQLEDLIDKSRRMQKGLRYEYNKIKSLPNPEEIDNGEIEYIYNQFKNGLGNTIKKSLDETIKFKSMIEEFQKTLINQRALELQDELKNVAENIRELDDEYSKKLKIIDQKGLMKNLKISMKVLNQKNSDYVKIKSAFNRYEEAEKKKKTLYLEKSKEILKIDETIDDNKAILDSFENTLSNIHEDIMGNKECSFSLDTIDKKTSKKTVCIDMRIFDDGSHSVDRTKVFIYDMSLLFNKFTRERHPCFLIHDNIFDVDQDTLVQSINFLAKQETKYQEFQYILTLNRDKIEHEEKLKYIDLNIEQHKVATYTKKSKFLNLDYQEE